MVENGYIRSMLVRFIQGAEVEPGVYYVDAIIQHQFIATSDLTFSTFEKQYYDMIETTRGELSEFLKIDSPTIKGTLKVKLIDLCLTSIKSKIIINI